MIDLDEAYSGAVIEELGRRGGRMKEMGPAGDGRMRLEYLLPGARPHRLPLAVPDRHARHRHPQPQLQEYGPYAGTLRVAPERRAIAQDDGETNTYGLFYLQERGQLFLGPGSRSTAGRSSACTRATTT